MLRSRPTRWLWCLAATLLPLATAHAAGDGWRYDTVHSQILFSISHNGYSRPFGRLHIARGWLRFDPDDWGTAATELDIDLASVDMGDADWNAAVCKPALLDCARHRYAHFISTGVEHTDDQHGVLHGQLTLRGVTRPLDLSFTFNRAAKTIYELHKVAGFSATAALDRSAFGISANAGSIGQQVSLWLELEATADDHAIPPPKEQP
jgi:polyisoprenoid-binding protein YceI